MFYPQDKYEINEKQSRDQNSQSRVESQIDSQSDPKDFCDIPYAFPGQPPMEYMQHSRGFSEDESSYQRDHKRDYRRNKKPHRDDPRYDPESPMLVPKLKLKNIDGILIPAALATILKEEC